MDSISGASPQNWSGLQPGQLVTVASAVGEAYSATVDVHTDDFKVLWVRTFDHRRLAFDYREGVVLIPA